MKADQACIVIFREKTAFRRYMICLFHVLDRLGSLICLRTRTVRVRTCSIDVNTRHNFVMHAHNDDVKANVTYTCIMRRKKFVWAGRTPCGIAQTENVCGRITARVKALP